MSIWSHFDDPELIRTFGRATYERGRDYALAGAVEDLVVQDSGAAVTLVTGSVTGSRTFDYDTNVTLVDQPGSPWLDSRCTCPVSRLCKHAVALVLAAREIAQGGAAAGPHWERVLDEVLDELTDAAGERTTPTRALGLEVGLAPTAALSRGARRRGPWGPGRGADPAPAPGRLRVRPVQRSLKGTWVRTHVSWTEVPNLELRADVDVAQARAMTQLLAAHQVTNRQTWAGAEPQLALGSFGPSLWTLLEEAVAAGVVLVPGKGLRSVRVAGRAGRVTLDVSGAGQHTNAQLRLGVAVEEGWHPGDRVEVLAPLAGAARVTAPTGHGVAVWEGEPGLWDVLLAPVDRPVGTKVARALKGGDRFAVPGEEVERLTTDYLPRLQRHLPVASSDASLAVPEAPRPRLVLGVHWRAVDEVDLTWTFRYRVGADDRVYGLDDTRGLRGIRAPEQEAELVTGLRLDETQTYRLCGGRREHGLRPEQVITGPAVIGFLDETLVPLEDSGQVEIDETGVRPSFTELHEQPEVSFTSAPEQPGPSTPHRLARPPGRDPGRRTRPLGLAQVLEAMTLGAERIILRDGAHVRIDRPEFAAAAGPGDRRRASSRTSPATGARARPTSGCGPSSPSSGSSTPRPQQWLRAARALRDLTGLPEVEPGGLRRSCAPTSSTGSAGWRSSGRPGWAGSSPTTWGWARRCRPWRSSPTHASEGAGPFLVVAPTSVVATWAHEAADLHARPDVAHGHRVPRAARRRSPSVHAGADLVVTSYTLYRLEADGVRRAATWGGLVLDEAQTVKNHQGKTYQAVRRLDVPFRLALTGTPMENRLMELWSLLSIVAPGLYPYPDRFAELVANPVEKEGDTEVLERFRRRIRPFLLRRTKELVAADLPPKQEQVLEVPLTPRHRKIYETHLQRERQNVLGLLGDFDKQRIAIFRSLTRLRQLSLDAGPGRSEEYDGIGSAKIDVLVDHLARGRRRGPPGAGVQPVHLVPHPGPARGSTREGIDARRTSTARTRKRGEVVERFKRGDGGGVPHQPQGRRGRADPDRGRLRLRPRPVVEPGRGGAGRRPRPPDRPEASR